LRPDKFHLFFRNLGDLEWLFAEQNELVSLDQELPLSSKLVHINVTHNKLTSMPEDLYLQTYLEVLLLNHNEIALLGGTLKKSKRLLYAGLTYNQITSVII
jgi:Leucine-rich repeat (LRR) protein